MNLFRRLTSIVGIISTLVAPKTAYATTQSIVDIEPAITGTSTYLLPTLAKRIVPVRDRIDLSRYGSMSEKERKEISDFVKFRYESRIEECPFGEYDRYDIIRDLAKGIEVPIGEGHKYLSGNVIRFILQ